MLFVGTLIPLHGIETVIEAAGYLRDRPDIEIMLVGDGQLGPRLQALLSENDLPQVRWERRWLSLAQLADHVGASEICLGVFGGPGKAERVLPFKVYYARLRGKSSSANRSCPCHPVCQSAIRGSRGINDP